MAIARGNGSNVSSFTASLTSPRTLSFDSGTGSNRILFVQVNMSTAASGYNRGDPGVSGVTYAGTSMTQLGTYAYPSFNCNQITSIWYLVAPATGSNNIVITWANGTSGGGCLACVYTGVDQINPLVGAAATNTNSTGTSLTVTKTIPTSNSWAVLFTANNYGVSSAGTGSTSFVAAGWTPDIYDSNGTVTPGSYSMTFTTAANASGMDGIMVALRPTEYAFSPDTGGTLDTNLKAYWRFEGNSNDEVAGVLNGTDTSITYGSSYGTVSQGASFNGSSSYISIPDGAGIDLEYNSAFSFNFWIKTTKTGAIHILSKQDGSADYRGFAIYGNGTTSGGFNIELTNANTNNKIARYSTSSANFNNGNWHMITVTYSGTPSAANLLCYVDGSSHGLTTQSDTLSGTTLNNVAMTIGRANYTAANYHSGDFDELGFWNKVLSATEISDLYNSGTSNSYYERAAASGPANLKTWNGIAKANLKTINGTAIANVKSWNGIT